MGPGGFSPFVMTLLYVLVLYQFLCFTSLSPSSFPVPVDCVSDGDEGGWRCMAG